ncbi:MAG TPA: hypothetical protein VFG73_08920 [Rhodanobacteraceae bacterium]|nr:hypothetical protein [Rhodanobacteraceae bacterium]
MSDATDAPATVVKSRGARGADAARLEYVTAWPPAVDSEAAAAISDLWRREGALGTDEAMADRMRQVVGFARDTHGRAVAVATAVPIIAPHIEQPVYYYRTFVAPDWRQSRAMLTLLRHAMETLKDYARPRGFPCIGILLELQAPKFAEHGRSASWRNPRFEFIGRSPRGYDLRVHYFRGAKLKPPSAAG